jgi:nitrogen fixation protein FixH
MRFFRLDDEHPFTGWHMLAIVAFFFGAIIAVNIAMAFAATGTFPGLVVRNSYVASQGYNELLAEARRQDEAGWASELRVQHGVLRFRLSGATGAPQTDITVDAHVGRPSTAREDRMVSFAPLGGGAFAAETRLPSGRWEVDVEAQRGGTLLYRNRQEVFVAQEESRP